MAKISEEEVGSSAPKDRMNPFQLDKEKRRNQSNFGKDPWARNFDAEVNSKGFTPTESAERTTQPTLRSQLVSQVSSEQEENTDQVSFDVLCFKCRRTRLWPPRPVPRAAAS